MRNYPSASEKNSIALRNYAKFRYSLSRNSKAINGYFCIIFHVFYTKLTFKSYGNKGNIALLK